MCAGGSTSPTASGIPARSPTGCGVRVTRRRTQRPHHHRARTPSAAVGTQCRSLGPPLGHPPGRAHRRLRRLESRGFGAGLVGLDRGRARRRAHPGRRPVRVAVGRRQLANRPGCAAAGQCDGAARRSVRRSAADPDGAAGRRRRRDAARRARTGTLPRRRRAGRSRLPDTSPAPRTCPAAAVLAGDGTFLDEDALASCSPITASNTTAALGAYCGSGVTASITLAALASPGTQASVVSRVVVGMEFGSRPRRCARRRLTRLRLEVCHAPSTAMRVERQARWSTCAFAQVPSVQPRAGGAVSSLPPSPIQ